jgi:hypothetical protein
MGFRGSGSSSRSQQLPPSLAFWNGPDRDQAHSRMTVARQDDVIARLGAPYQIGELALRLADGNTHLASLNAS